MGMANTHFSIRVNLPSGKVISVFRETDQQFEKYIALEGIVTISPEHQALLTKMPQDQRQRVLRDLSIEVSRVRTDFSSAGLEQVGFGRRLLISNLTETLFIENLGELESLSNVIIQTLLRDLGQ